MVDSGRHRLNVPEATNNYSKPNKLNRGTIRLSTIVLTNFGSPIMERFSSLWWFSILLSSVVTGGGSFVLLTVLTELPTETVIKISVMFVLVGDVVLALLMQAVSPTRITLGPGERRRKTELPMELGTVISDFEDRRGRVSIRGERWRARQTAGCSATLKAGALVRVVDREGLTLVVTSAGQH